jgi:hypothetical protein
MAIVRATLRSGPESLILARENQRLIIKLKQEMNSYLARENQREYSKVPFARPGTMYRKGCDYLQ